MTRAALALPEVATQSENGVLEIALAGDWTAATARRAEAALDAALTNRMAPPQIRFDGSAVGTLDTFGAWVILKRGNGLATGGAAVEDVGFSGPQAQLLAHLRQTSAQTAPRRSRLPLLLRPFDSLGRRIVGTGNDLITTQAVQGRILAAFGAVLVGRGRMRLPALVNQLEQVVFHAVPIVALISLVVGAIVTQQGLLQLSTFGAEIFVVDLNAILMLREVGLLLAAIMVAGRSGSAITAEIGSMRMREEIDALRVMGVDPYQALILPRMLALVIGLPMLAFIGALAGLVGAAIVTTTYGQIPLGAFIDRLQGAISMQSFLIGMIKAPVMGFIIGLIATNEGFKVAGSSESLGRHTTASVVKAIFMVILADGLFAILFAAWAGAA